ncbi:MAG: glutamate racemase [Eubacterium sp.]|nr:glutamate racemase [Eubacterium sp.]
MKIGFFDSGIGGLTVLHEAYHLLEGSEYIFYGDTDHVPYGLKTNDEIMGYADDILKFFVNENVDAAVIACNTASAVAAKRLREKYSLPIIAMEPAVRPALKTDERILVLATPVTLREEKLKNLIKREGGDGRTDLLPLPDLVGFAEKEEFDSENVREYLSDKFSDYDVDLYSAVVLGCTHFNYFKDVIREYFSDKTELIDGAVGAVKRAADLLGAKVKTEDEKLEIKDINSLFKTYKTTYYFSGKKVVDDASLSHIMRLHNRLEKMRNIS